MSKINIVTITIAVPTYSRPTELCYLIDSVLKSSVLPNELLIVEDNSPDRNKIRNLVECYKERFEGTGCILNYIENKNNIGYDANLRKSIEESASDYVLVLGNDDALYPEAVLQVRNYIKSNPDVKFISRAYSRFVGQSSNIINTTWLAKSDALFHRYNSSGGLVFRLSGFFGGLVINRMWAKIISTTEYDGTLYYQYYLACTAFLDNGIGYIAKPTTLCRANNPPLFGSAAPEAGYHTPGIYTPSGRAKMWAGILRITKDIDDIYHSTLIKDVRRELSQRQSFHIFEMMPIQGRKATLILFAELRKLHLTSNWLSWVLFIYILIFGKYSSVGFSALRKIQFTIENRIHFKL